MGSLHIVLLHIYIILGLLTEVYLSYTWSFLVSCVQVLRMPVLDLLVEEVGLGIYDCIYRRNEIYVLILYKGFAMTSLPYFGIHHIENKYFFWSMETTNL